MRVFYISGWRTRTCLCAALHRALLPLISFPVRTIPLTPCRWPTSRLYRPRTIHAADAEGLTTRSRADASQDVF